MLNLFFLKNIMREACPERMLFTFDSGSPILSAEALAKEGWPPLMKKSFAEMRSFFVK
jgi:hypothetical protein